MARTRRQQVFKNADYEIRAIGVRRPELRDLYHWLLSIPWWAMAGVIVGGYLGLNALFACAYLLVGGVANAAPGSYSDAFFFSVQTMGTIGYGGMTPATPAANVLVVAESVVGLLVTALSTGLVFVRFSQTRARMVFGRRAAIGPMDGVPTLMLRLGNDRRTAVVDATFRLVLSTTVHTAEGTTFYRSQELTLARERAATLSRAWTVLHKIGPESPLAGVGPERLAALDAELSLSVLGLDELSMQPVFARHVWGLRDIIYGARLADILEEHPDGNLTIDLTRFHDLQPTVATETFPYAWSGPTTPGAA